VDAWRWLRVQGAAVKRAQYLGASEQDLDRLALLLLSLPALESAGVTLHARPDASLAAFLAAAGLAVACCSRLKCLELVIVLTTNDYAPVVEVAEAPALERLTAGLAGLSRLRELALELTEDYIGGRLPACISCLAQLTSLSLGGIYGLRCAPGWARLPALELLHFRLCQFAGDGEEALPGMDALVSLTSLSMFDCYGLRVFPASLWRLPQLCSLSCWPECGPELCDVPRGELPVAGLPASAPCFAVFTHLTLAGYNLPACPPGILAMRRLKQLDLSYGCFEHLPGGVSALTALEKLRLGRHTAAPAEIGGAFHAQALGSLARFPCLRELSFNNCSVQFCASFAAAAAHPRLELLELDSSFPTRGPSCRAFLAFVGSLLQQGRSRVVKLCHIFPVVQGEGRRDSRNFLAALHAVSVDEYDNYCLSDDEE